MTPIQQLFFTPESIGIPDFKNLLESKESEEPIDVYHEWYNIVKNHEIIIREES